MVANTAKSELITKGEVVTGLEPFTEDEATVLATYKLPDAVIKKLARKYGGKKLPENLDNPKDLVFIKTGHKEIQGLVTKVEERRTGLKAGVLKRGRLIDGEAKRLTELLLKIRDPMKLLISTKNEAEKRKKEEAKLAEEKRVGDIRQKIIHIEGTYMACDGRDTEYVNEVIQRLNDTVIDAATFGEFIEDAQAAITATLDRLAEYLTRRKEFEEKEADFAIAEAGRKKQEKIEAAQRAEREKADAKRQKDMNAQQAKMDAQQKVIDDAEKVRLAAEAKERDDNERKAREDADEKEREKQMKRSILALKKVLAKGADDGTSETMAQNIMGEIIGNKIPNIKWERN